MARQALVAATILLGAISARADEIARNRNTLAAVQYIGSSRCAACHAEIYKRYRATAMGRSLAAATDLPELKRIATPVRLFSAKLNRYYKVYRDGASSYQAEYELNAAGATVFEATQ